jgi:phosphoserine phosphatase
MGKTHVIDGVTYIGVQRGAKIGDKIIVVAGHGWYKTEVGSVFRVIDGADYGFGRFPDCERGAVYVEHRDNRCGDSINFVSCGNYLVLEPLEEMADIHGLLANLARRVSSLEQQLISTQTNVEKLAEELANVTHWNKKHATMFGKLYEDVRLLKDCAHPKEVEVVTFEKFLDSVADDVAKKLAEKVTNDLRTEMRLKALRGVLA